MTVVHSVFCASVKLIVQLETKNKPMQPWTQWSLCSSSYTWIRHPLVMFCKKWLCLVVSNQVKPAIPHAGQNSSFVFTSIFHFFPIYVNDGHLLSAVVRDKLNRGQIGISEEFQLETKTIKKTKMKMKTFLSREISFNETRNLSVKLSVLLSHFLCIQKYLFFSGYLYWTSWTWSKVETA